MIGPVSILLDTPLTFDVADGAVHCPMVQASVDGTPTKLILDTGSTDHVLTIELANSSGLRSTEGEAGVDHAGRAVPSRTIGEVTIEIEGLALQLRDVVAIEGPPPFEGWGVGGFLSPQNLHTSAYAVIDLAEKRLLLVDGETSVIDAWLRERTPTLRMLSMPRGPAPTVVVRGSIEPWDGVDTMLNTGSSGTEFERSAVPGLRGTAPGETGLGLSGADVLGEEVKGQTLRVADARFPVDVLLVRDSMPPPPGLVGMDVLQGSVLAVSADMGRPVLWLVAD